MASLSRSGSRWWDQVKAEPDVAILGVSVEVIDVDLQKAKASVDQTIGRLIALARELKLAEEDVTATQLIIHPEQLDSN